MEKEEIRICEFCGVEISKEKLRKHLKVKHINAFNSVYDLTIYILKNVELLTDKNINNILVDFQTIPTFQIDIKYKFRFRKYITDLGLKHRTVKESNDLDSTINKRRNTIYDVYGVDNVSKNQTIKQKKKDTFTKNYGVDNIWKLREYRLWLESEMLKKYGKVYLADLYGNENLWGREKMTEPEKKDRIVKIHIGFDEWYKNLSPEDLELYIKNKTAHISNSIYYTSSLETRIEKILLNNVIDFEPQKWVGRYPYDFSFGKKILEVQGTYWYCDNRFYKGDDIIKRNGDNLLCSEVWERDLMKKKLAEKYGYEVFYIWEYDMKNMSDDDILNYIKNKIM